MIFFLLEVKKHFAHYVGQVYLHLYSFNVLVNLLWRKILNKFRQKSIDAQNTITFFFLFSCAKWNP